MTQIIPDPAGSWSDVNATKVGGIIASRSSLGVIGRSAIVCWTDFKAAVQTSGMAYLNDLSSTPTQKIWGENMTARAVQGKNLTLGILELHPHGRVPEHHHDAEQIGVCIRGSLVWLVGGETYEVKAGGTWNFPSGIPHECYAGDEGAVLIEGFSPPRYDWAQFELEAASTPEWLE